MNDNVLQTTASDSPSNNAQRNVTCGLDQPFLSFHRDHIVTQEIANIEDLTLTISVYAKNSMGEGPPSNPLVTTFYNGKISSLEFLVS